MAALDKTNEEWSARYDADTAALITQRIDEVAATRDTLVSKYETEASAAKASREKREKELSGKVSVLEQSEGGLMGKKVELEAQAGWS